MTDSKLQLMTQREQLMEDIDSIISGFFNDTYEGEYPEECEDLTRILHDNLLQIISDILRVMTNLLPKGMTINYFATLCLAT